MLLAPTILSGKGPLAPEACWLPIGALAPGPLAPALWPARKVPRPARALHPVAERDHVFDDARGVARGDGKDFRQLSPRVPARFQEARRLFPLVNRLEIFLAQFFSSRPF